MSIYIFAVSGADLLYVYGNNPAQHMHHFVAAQFTPPHVRFIAGFLLRRDWWIMCLITLDSFEVTQPVGSRLFSRSMHSLGRVGAGAYYTDLDVCYA